MGKRRKEKILIIDDEENIRKSLKMIFEYEGYMTLEASTGEEGLQLIDETVGLDLILLDIRLPGKDGLEILSELKQRPYSPEVIMVSGGTTSGGSPVSTVKDRVSGLGSTLPEVSRARRDAGTFRPGACGA